MANLEARDALVREVLSGAHEVLGRILTNPLSFAHAEHGITRLKRHEARRDVYYVELTTASGELMRVEVFFGFPSESTLVED